MAFLIDYPNPLLSSERDDYNENCKFDIVCSEESITVDENNIVIPVEIILECDGLKKYVENNEAEIVVLINSSAAFFRKTFVLERIDGVQTIAIPKFCVKDKIEFSGYILTKKDIANFSCPNEFNELYFNNATFNIKKGELLAKGETRVIPVDGSELEKPISSIFTIERNQINDSEIEVDLVTDEKIIVRVCDRLNDLYYQMKDFNNGSLTRYLTGMIVYPALVEAVAKMCGNDRESYSDKRWFRAIENKLEKMKIDLSTDNDYSYTFLADKLLGGITQEGLRSVKDTIDDEVNNGEVTNLGGKD